MNDKKNALTGVVVKAPDYFQNRTEITVHAIVYYDNDTEIKTDGLVLISAEGRHNIAYGDVIRFNCKLKIPQNFKNFGGYDYKRYLRFKDISVRGYIRSPADMIVIKNRHGNRLNLWLENFRSQIKELISENVSSPEREIVQAMILGNQKEIPTAVNDEFNATGTSHIIAISGFNISIIALFFFFLIRSVLKFSPYVMLRFNVIKLSIAISIIPIIFFAFIAGASVSVVRATIMVVIFMLSMLMRRSTNIYNATALAGFIILIFTPYSLFDISFQLSFMAVLSIVFFAPKIKTIVTIKNNYQEKWQSHLIKTINNIILFFAVTISAIIGSAPILLFYFNRFSLVALFANVAIVPIMGVVTIPICTAIIFVTPFSISFAIFLAKISAILVGLSVKINHLFASLAYSSVYLPTPTLWEIGFYYAFIFALGFLISKNDYFTKKRKLLLAVIVLCVMLFVADYVFLHYRNSHTKNLTLNVIDVGEGNAIFIKFPSGKTMLIDGGGSIDNNRFDIGKMIVAPFLWKEKITKIDFVVLTHPHHDHLNGLNFVVKNFVVGEVWKNNDSYNSTTYREFMETIIAKKIPLRIITHTG
ncbi:MAG: DNA internalization-related competence protein ComEC/Rec2, partial [Deltaproteobacteria bacterium]